MPESGRTYLEKKPVAAFTVVPVWCVVSKELLAAATALTLAEKDSRKAAEFYQSGAEKEMARLGAEENRLQVCSEKMKKNGGDPGLDAVEIQLGMYPHLHLHIHLHTASYTHLHLHS